LKVGRAFTAFVAIPLFLGLAACSSGDDNTDTPPAPTQASTASTGGGGGTGGAGTQATATPVRTGTTPTTGGGGGGGSSEVAAVATAYAGVRSYRATVVVEAPGAPAQQIQSEIVLPDRFHITVAGGLELIIIGGDTYTKLGTTWSRQSIPGTTSLFDPRTIAQAVQSFTAAGATRGGTTTVGSVNCTLYTFTTAAGSQEVCVGSNNLPVRIVSTATGGAKTTVTFSDFNANITISPPI
jgi:hypothetical protein